MANLKYYNTTTSAWEEIKVSTRLTTYQNRVILSTVSGTASIGITQFNPADDVLLVFQDSTYIQNVLDYTISGDGLTIYHINNPSQTWNANTCFDFIVLKNVQRDIPSADGSLIQNGSITDAKLATGIQIMPSLTDIFGNTALSLKDRLQHFDSLIDGIGINVMNYNASGSNQTTTGSINAVSNILTVTDAKDFKVGQGIIVSGVIAGVAEIASLTINAGCTVAGNVTVTLDGVTTNIALTTSDSTPNLVAAKIRAISFPNWTVSGTNNIITFTYTSHGARLDLTYNASTTGASGSPSTITQGVNDADLYTVISSMNGFALTLRDVATMQLSGTLIKHDDNEAFQNTITAAIAKGRREIYVPYPINQYNIRILTSTSSIMFISDNNNFTLGSYKIYSISKNVDSIGDITTLNTTAKTSTVAGINEVKSSIDTHKADTVSHVLQADKDNWNSKATVASVTTVDTKVGDTTTLNTTNKTNTVAAINEGKVNFDSHNADAVRHVLQADKDSWNAKPTMTQLNTTDSKVGDPLTLTTTNKTNTVLAINETKLNIDTHKADTVSHVLQADKDNWNGKATVASVTTVDGKVGDITTLTTTTKASATAAINELKANKLEGLLSNTNIATNAAIVASKLAIQKMYRKSQIYNPIATANTYGTPVDLLPATGFVSLTPLGIEIDFGGTFGSETVTAQFIVTFSDATIATVTKTTASTGTILLNVTDMITLASDGLYINKISVQSKSSIASSTTTVTFSHYGYYL